MPVLSSKTAKTAGLLGRRLVFVTGKGGVGKSTVSAALALLGAQRGRRTLACELDAKGDLGALFETSPLAFTPRQVFPGLWGMAMDTEESLDEYLRLQLRLPGFARMGSLAKAFDFVATAAPGVREILTVGKLAYEVRERHYDLVVADASATGQMVGQLTAPQAINSLVRVGAIRSQTDWVVDILADHAVTGLVAVTTPEEMPVRETIDLVAKVTDETDVDVAAVVVNRVLPELFSRHDEEVFERLREPAMAARLSDAAGGDVEPVFDAARLAVTLRRARAAHLDLLRESIHPSIPLLYVPELFTRGSGLRTTGQVAEALSAELGY
ncbi:MAG: anion-transporting ATPase [Actinomycetota bacterium]|nr:anion-transporting ATPase [Actinomycetota bacterium]